MKNVEPTREAIFYPGRSYGKIIMFYYFRQPRKDCDIVKRVHCGKNAPGFMVKAWMISPCMT